MTLSNSLLVGNQSVGGSDGAFGIGGGIMNFAGSTFTILEQHAHRQRGRRGRG